MNISQITHAALDALGESGIVWTVTVLLVVLFVAGIRVERYRSMAPALMTSLGILGTFCGIFLALYGFDPSPEKIDKSVLTLLEGMKTAFITSLLGLFSSISFRIFASPLSRLMTSKETLPVERREILQRLDAIKESISGTKDANLVDQIQKLREENRDGFNTLEDLNETIRKALLANLEVLINDIREIIGKQLGDSLKELINNIEEALIKQFGETFIEFNAATQAIKRWQEEHKDQVEQLTKAFNLSAEKIGQIAKNCNQIPKAMEQLLSILEAAHKDINLLNNLLEAFSEMRKSAERSFPVIKRYLNKIGTDLGQSAQAFEGLEETIRRTFKSAEEETSSLMQKHSASMEEMVGNMRETLENAQRESVESLDKTVQGVLDKFGEEMRSAVDTLAKEWGGNMVSIATRCEELIAQTKRTQ